MSRYVRQLFTGLAPSNNGLFFNIPYLLNPDQLCDQPVQCTNEALFLSEMKKRGYGNVLMTVVSHRGLISVALKKTLITPDHLYSGIFPGEDANGEFVIRGGNVGTWMTSILSSAVIARGLEVIGFISTKTVPAVLARITIGTGIAVLISWEQYQDIRHADDNIDYVTSYNVDLKDTWFVFDSFYHKDFDEL